MSASTTTVSGEQPYTIASGDTLSKIAAKFNTTVAWLAQRNAIANPDRIYAGQVIYVPGAPPGNSSVTPAQPLNPYRDASPWGLVTIGSIPLPGVVMSIDGHEKPEDWNVQKGTSSSHATTVWKGTKLAEEIKIVLNLYDEDQFDAYYVVRDTLRPKIGSKPPSLPIVNAAINFAGVTRIACKNLGPPKPARGLSWTAEVTLIEYNPSKAANAGPASAAKASDKTPSENDKLADQLAAAMAAAAKAGAS